MNLVITWAPAISVLIAGAVTGVIFIWWALRGRKTAAGPRELIARRDAILDELRQLAAPANGAVGGKVAEKRRTLELECAAVIRQIEANAAPADPPTAVRATGRRRAALGFASGVAVAAIVGGIIYGIERTANAESPQVALPPSAAAVAKPVDPASGPQHPQKSTDPELVALRQKVEANFDSVDARLDLARAALVKNDMMEVFEQTRFVLAKDPNNARALSYGGIVRLAMGEPDQAVAMLTKATQLQPDVLDPWIHLALVQAQLGHRAEAEAAIREAEKRHPEKKAVLEQMLAQIKSTPVPPPSAQTGSPAARASADVPPDHPAISMPGNAASTPPTGHEKRSVMALPSGHPLAAGAGEGTLVVSGTLRLDNPAAKVSSPAIVFLIARQAGKPGTPPMLVKRISVNSFPVAFSMSTGDSMMVSGELPKAVRLEARIDADGDAMTHAPGEPAATIDPLKVGSTGVQVSMK